MGVYPMKFLVEKENMYNGIKIVERATVIKGLQPVLANILIETVAPNKLIFSATDFDLSIITEIDAQIEEEGKITLPAKKLMDIISRLNDGLVTFELCDNTMTITNKKTKFEIIGISASEFPKIEEVTNKEDEIEIDMEPFTKAIKEAAFAAAGYETNNLLSGVVCDINKNVLEIASTDGNRLARARKIINNRDDKVVQLILPSKVLQEFLKMSYLLDDENVKFHIEKTRIMIESGKTKLISRLMEGQYPRYNQLIPTTFPKEAKINVSMIIKSLERVSTMVNEKTSIVKLKFSENKLSLMGDTPDAGASQDEIEIIYHGEDMLIGFNYKYLLDCFKNLESEELIIGMNTNLSATVLKPDNEEDFVYLVMPVQIR